MIKTPIMILSKGVTTINIGLSYFGILIVGLGLIGAWIAMLSDQIIRWIGITMRYRTGKWKHIKLK